MLPTGRPFTRLVSHYLVASGCNFGIAFHTTQRTGDTRSSRSSRVTDQGPKKTPVVHRVHTVVDGRCLNKANWWSGNCVKGGRFPFLDESYFTCGRVKLKVISLSLQGFLSHYYSKWSGTGRMLALHVSRLMEHKSSDYLNNMQTTSQTEFLMKAAERHQPSTTFLKLLNSTTFCASSPLWHLSLLHLYPPALLRRLAEKYRWAGL